MKLLFPFYLILFSNLINAQKNKENSKVNQYNTTIGSAKNVTINGGTIKISNTENYEITANFSITPYLDTMHFSKYDFPFELRPLKGVWFQPFCAYLFEEQDSVKGALIPNFKSLTGLVQQSNTRADFIINGEKKDFLLWTTPSNQATPTSGSIFNCRKKPSILLFGDLSNQTNQFLIRLN